MLYSKLPKDIKQALFATFVASVIVGGLVGGTVGVSVAGWSLGATWSPLAQLVGMSADTSYMHEKQTQDRDQVVVESSATVDVVASASPAVVTIVVTQDVSQLYNRTGPFYFEDFLYGSPQGGDTKREVGGGTGFLVTTDGMIVTNRHVVEEASAEYTVLLSDGTQYEATVLARDDLNDIALLRIDADNLPVLDLGDSDALRIGQTVIAIGNSLNEFRNTVTKGIVSGINRRVVAGGGSFSEVIEEAIQTDAAINPGNSGGPLLDLFGKVVGVNTAVSREGQLIGFAIPVNEVRHIIESVQKNGRIVRPFLGVRYIVLTEEIAQANDIADVSSGALIVRGETQTDLAVVPGSPADKAGLVENDIILAVNGEEVTRDHSLARILSRYAPGNTVTLTVYSKGETNDREVTLVERE